MSQHGTPPPRPPQDETDREPMPHDQCVNATRIRTLERRVDAATDRLHEGDLALQRLSLATEHLAREVATQTIATNSLTAAVNAMKLEQVAPKASPWGDEVKKALIQWAVPIGMIALFWLLLQSGAVAVKGVTPHQDQVEKGKT